MTQALITIGHANAATEVDVYRDGPVVTVIARAQMARENPYGEVRTNGLVTQQYSTVEAFEHDRDKVIKRASLGYARIKGLLKIDDDARRAPPLPEALRYLLPDHMRAFSSQTSTRSTSSLHLLPMKSGGVR